MTPARGPVGTVEFRRLTRDDFGLLARWLAEPHVHRWWHHDATPEALERDFGGVVDGTEPAEDHVVLLDGEPVGVVQCCRFVDYPEYRAEVTELHPLGEGAVTIDFFLGEPHLVGRGVGAQMIAAFVRRIWATEPSATHVVVPVVSANQASWRALLRVGFRLVAEGELAPDNPIDDPHHVVLRIDRPV